MSPRLKRESNLLILFLTEALPSSVSWCQRNSSTRIHHRSERLQGIIIWNVNESGCWVFVWGFKHGFFCSLEHCWNRSRGCGETADGLWFPCTHNVFPCLWNAHDWADREWKQGTIRIRKSLHWLFFSLSVSQLDNKNCLQAELDRFCDTLISIREEIAQIEKGNADVQNNVLKVTEITNLIFSTVLHRYRRWGCCLFVCLCVFSGSSTFSSYANVRHMEEAVFPRVRCFPYPMAPICQVLANHRY